jgi:hypothetical protein
MNKISTSDLVENFNSANSWLTDFAQRTQRRPEVERILLESAARLDERGVDPSTWSDPEGAEGAEGDTPDNVVALVPDGDDSEG